MPGRWYSVVLCVSCVFNSAVWTDWKTAGPDCWTDIVRWERASSAAGPGPPSSSRRWWRRSGPPCSLRTRDCPPCGDLRACHRSVSSIHNVSNLFLSFPFGLSAPPSGASVFFLARSGQEVILYIKCFQLAAYRSTLGITCSWIVLNFLLPSLL